MVSATYVDLPTQRKLYLGSVFEEAFSSEDDSLTYFYIDFNMPLNNWFIFQYYLDFENPESNNSWCRVNGVEYQVHHYTAIKHFTGYVDCRRYPYDGITESNISNFSKFDISGYIQASL